MQLPAVGTESILCVHVNAINQYFGKCHQGQ